MTYKFLLIIIVSLFVIVGCEEENSPADDNSAVEVANDITNIIPVEAMVVNEKIIEQKLPLTGVLAPNNSADLIVEVSGKVKSVKKEIGDYVSVNQTLAIIDDIIPESQYKQAQAQVLSSESNLKIAESNLKSDKTLFENGDISELEFNSSQSSLNNAKAQYLSAIAVLSAAKKTFEDTRIKSPISGFVSRKNIDFGTMASVGTAAFRVVDISKLKLRITVPQELINKVKVGGKANVRITALNGKMFNGKVKQISPQADETTGGFLVEVSVTNIDNIIKAGMTAKIELLLSNEKSVLAIPEYSLVSKNDENYVYKIVDDFAELVKLDLGESMGENIVVENGLSAGDKIVTVGMKNLGVKTKVNVEKLH